MMGRTHYATGVCAGAYVAWGVRHALVPAPAHMPVPAPAYALQVLICVVGALALTWLAGKAAYWPDLDHHGSHSTRRWGLLSRGAHEVVEGLSIDCFDFSATEKDKAEGDFRNHRGLTHFLITALLFGLACGVATWQLTLQRPSLVWGIACGALIAHALARRVPRKRKRTRMLVGLLGTAALATVVGVAVPTPAGLDVVTVAQLLGLGVGLSVATGMIAHDLGDAATLAGVPFFWPLRIRGQRYWAFHVRRPEKRTRTTKDSPTERRIRIASWTLLVVPVLGWVPGLYEHGWTLATRLLS